MLRSCDVREKRFCDLWLCREEVWRVATSLHVKVTELGRRRERQVRDESVTSYAALTIKVTLFPFSITYSTVHTPFFSLVKRQFFDGAIPLLLNSATRKTAYLEDSCDSLYHDTIHE
jgi:hypothetical protein